MLKITKVNKTRVDIELSGELDADGMAHGLDELIAASEGVEKGKMLYKIPSFVMPSLGAFGVEITRMPKLLSLLGKYERCAVVTGSDWLQKMAEWEGMLMPGLTIKGFDLDEVEEAEAWVEG